MIPHMVSHKYTTMKHLRIIYDFSYFFYGGVYGIR